MWVVYGPRVLILTVGLYFRPRAFDAGAYVPWLESPGIIIYLVGTQRTPYIHVE